MAVLNYRLKRIEGHITDTESKKVDVNSNFSIVSLKRAERPGIGKFLEVEFKFDVEYEPEVGSVKLSGILWYSEDGMEKKITEKGDRMRLEPDLVKGITTGLVRESLFEIIPFARKLGLPIPIKLPSVEMRTPKLDFKKAA